MQKKARWKESGSLAFSPDAKTALTVNTAQHNICASDNRNGITHFVTAQQFWDHLQVAEGRRTHFRAPGVFAAIADEVEAILPTAVLNDKVRFSPAGTQRNRHTSGNGARWHLINGNPAEANTLVDFLKTHHIAGKAVPFLAYLHIDRYLAVSHIGTGRPDIKIDAACTHHWTCQSIGNSLLRINVAYTLSACLKDFITCD